ncbi:glycoside hydrolase family 53 protein [Ekhidna sp.]
MTSLKHFLFAIAIITATGCSSLDDDLILNNQLILGADLSYLNEMLDCNATYNNQGIEVNPYDLFANEGCQMVRIRKWHSPSFNKYSGLLDVTLASKEATKRGMQILLDLHYSDTWADPSKQIIPKAWQNISELNVLGDSVYNYTLMVLNSLNNEGVVPEIVQIGNEINSEILMTAEVTPGQQINWSRNAFLINRGLEAVDEFNRAKDHQVQTLIHIAQPENVSWWFEEAEANDVSNFDWIGISYYPQWSTIPLERLSDELKSIRNRFEKRVLIVETAYPYTLTNTDKANNILGKDASIEEFGVSPSGQLNYLNALKSEVLAGEAEGIIYWEPTWVSTDCFTQWSQGSHWDNATFFDASNNNEALDAFSFFE